MLTNPEAVDYGSIAAALNNPNNTDFDSIESDGLFYDIVNFNLTSVTFQSKSNITVTGQEPTSINVTFKKGLTTVSTSQVILSVGIPILKPINEALDALNVEPEISPTYEAAFFAEASDYFGSAQSTNVEAGVSLGLSYGYFTFEVKTAAKAALADNQSNITTSWGNTATATVSAPSTGPVKVGLTAEYSDLFQQTGTPQNNADIHASVSYSLPPEWWIDTIGLNIGVESAVGTQHGIFYNEEGYIKIIIKLNKP